MSQITMDWARAYIARGFHIIPLQYRTKDPAVPEVVPYRERFPTEDELKKWFLYNNHNIGIITGAPSGLFVVDIDDPAKAEDYLKKYPTPLVARSPRGGSHLYYEYHETDLSISGGVLGDDIDTRGNGGYIVAEPSQVLYDKPSYQDHPMFGKTGQYEWVSKGEPAPLPAELAKTLREKTVKKVGNIVILPDGAEDGRNLLRRVMLDGFTTHKHNQEAKDVARFLYRMGLAEAVVVDLLQALDARDETPLGNDELIPTIKSGIGYEKSRKEAEQQDKTAQAENSFRVVRAGDALLEFSGYDVNWLVKDFVPENAVLGLFAPPESYKTWILFDLAVSVALGEQAVPFLGTFDIVGPPKPVLIVQQEDYMGQVAQRLRTILSAKSKTITYNMHEYVNDLGQRGVSFGSPYFAPLYLHPDSALSFNNQASMQALEETIKGLGIKLVVIDPLYMLEKIDDSYFASAAQGGMAALKALRSMYGTTFVLAHHTNKKGLDGRDAMYGSQLLNGAFEGVWMVREQEKRLQLTKQGKFFKNRRSYALEFTIDTTPPQLLEDGEVSGGEEYLVKATDTTDVVLSGKHDVNVLKVLEDQSEPITQRQIAKELGIADKLVKDSLDRLIEADFVLREGRKYYIPTNVEF